MPQIINSDLDEGLQDCINEHALSMWQKGESEKLAKYMSQWSNKQKQIARDFIKQRREK